MWLFLYNPLKEESTTNMTMHTWRPNYVKLSVEPNTTGVACDGLLLYLFKTSLIQLLFLYVPGSSDEESKKTALRSAASSGMNCASPRMTIAPKIKDPVHADRNISFRSSSLRAYTSQQQPASIQPCDVEVQTEGASIAVREMSTFGLCKDLMTMALTRFSCK